MDSPTILHKPTIGKYVKILQVDARPSTTFQSGYSSPLSSSKIDDLKKLVYAQNPLGLRIKPNRTYSQSQHTSAKLLSPKPESSPHARLNSCSSSQQRILTSPSEYVHTVETGEDKTARKLEAAGLKDKKATTAREGFNFSKSAQKDIVDINQLPKTPNPKENPYLEREITLEDVFKAGKELNKELNAIVNQEYDQTLKVLIKSLNVKEFTHIQKKRISNAIKIVLKGFMPKEGKESKLRKEILNLVSLELNRVRSMYEQFLYSFEDVLVKVSKGKTKVYDHRKPWEALKLLIEHSYMSREKKDDEEEDPSQKIYEFKLNYKTSKDFDKNVLDTYELVEVHMRDLNRLIEMERERYALLLQEHEQLLAKCAEQDESQGALKKEIMANIYQSNRKGEENKKSYLEGPSLQEKFLENRVDELVTENLKLFDEAFQLRKDVKELKHELKKMIEKAEKAPKQLKDKGIMVDLYNSMAHTTKHKGLSPYVQNPSLCRHTNELPKGVMYSIMNLMLADKMITDMCDDFDRRPRKPLNSYLVEWFLKRFGLYDFCEVVIQDFIYTLHNTESEERFKTFREMLGTSKEFQTAFRFSFSKHSQLDIQKLRKKFFGTSEMLADFYKIINCIKTICGPSMSHIFPSHNYGPFMINPEATECYLSLELATQVITTISKEANFTPEEVNDIKEYLQIRTHEQEIASRMSLEEVESKSERKEPSVNLDVFVRFVFEALVEKRIRGFERYYTVFKTHIVAQKQGNISYEEYANSVSIINPEANQAWKDHSFASLMCNQTANEVPLYVLIEGLIDSYFNTDKAKEFSEKVKSETDSRIFKDTPPRPSNLNSLKVRKDPFAKGGSILLQPQTPFFWPRSSRNKLFPSSKEGLALGNSSLNDMAYEIYDAVSSLIVLQEMYLWAEESIRAAEKNHDDLGPLHAVFVKDMEMFPKQAIYLQKFEPILAFDKEELVDGLEHLWTRLRVLIVHTFRRK